MLLQPPNFANILIVYFDFMYYLFVSPFRFVHVQSNKKTSESHWKIHSNKFQQTSSILLGVLGLFANLVSFRAVLSSSKDNERNSDFYFALLSFSFALVSRVTIYKTLWCRSQTFLDIINLLAINSTKFLNFGSQTIWKNKLTWIAIHTIYLFVILFQFISFVGLFNHDSDILLYSLVERAYKTFFLGSNIIANNTAEYRLSLRDCFEVTLFVFVWLNNFLVEYFLLWGLFIATFVLWIASINFRNSLEFNCETRNSSKESMIFSSSKVCINKGKTYERYILIKKLCNLISSAFGNLLIWCLGNYIFALPRNIDFILFGDDLTRQLFMMMLLVISITMLVLAAEVVTNVRIYSN